MEQQPAPMVIVGIFIFVQQLQPQERGQPIAAYMIKGDVMPIEFEVSTTINSSPEKIYHAWLDSTQHGEMTGGGAKGSTEIGGEFTAWDGYISGRNVELIPGERIVQTWRTSEFEASDPDSNLEVILDSIEGGTKLTLRHTNLPAHGMQYEQGWVENYFEPMKRYFED